MIENNFNLPMIIEKYNLNCELTPIKKIEIIEHWLFNQIDPRERIDFKITHHIHDGLYAREIFLPKDTILTGRVHKFAHLNMISKGDVSVYTEHDGLQRIKASFTWYSKVGVKRLIYVHEDTIWTTFHITDTTDVNAFEDELTTMSDLSWIDDELRLLETK